jgi:hypothetical protein
MCLNLQPLGWVIETVRPNPVSGGLITGFERA